MVIPIMVTSGLQPQRQSSLRTTAVTIERQLSGLSQLPNLPTFKKPFKIDLLRAEFRQTHLFAWLVSFIFPHIFLCVGFLFLVVHSRLPSALPPTACLTHNLLTHTQLVHTHNFLTQNLLSHNLLTHNLSIHNLLTHTTCSHTTCPHTTYSHTTCPHTTYSHTTCPHTTYSHTHNLYTHTTYSHTITHTQLTLRGRRGTWRYRPPLCVAGVALGDIHLHFAWQAWHLRHWAGSGGALGPRLAPWSPRLFAWQAWHMATSTCILRGRRGTWQHRLAFCVAGVALGDRHTWAPFGAVVARGGRPGTRRHRPSLCVAGVALGDIDVHSVWQAWHLAAHLGPVWRRGRGTWRHRPSLCVAGVALGDIDVHSAWQVWHLWHCATKRGKRGTWRHPPALGDIHLCFAWHLVTSTLQVSPSLSNTTLSRATLSRTICHISFSYATLSHTTLSNTTLSHITFSHTSLSHTTLSPTTLSHTHTTLSSTTLSPTTLSHTTLSHTIFVTHNLSHMQLLSHTHLCHTHTTLSHTTLSHTTFSHTQSFTHNFLTHDSSHITFKMIDPPPSPLCLFFFLRAASTTFSDYWKNLTCGVIRSFNFWLETYLHTYTHYNIYMCRTPNIAM